MELEVDIDEVLGGPGSTIDVAKALIDEGKTQRVSLPRDVAVYLLYWTAYAGTDGAINISATLKTASVKPDNNCPRIFSASI